MEMVIEAVFQLVRRRGCEPRGCGFKSHPSPFIITSFIKYDTLFNRGIIKYIYEYNRK